MTTTTASDSTTADLVKSAGEAKEHATKLLASVKSTAAAAQKAAQEQMQERPYTVLGAAAGAGFVLAGGLASSITRGIVSAGTKLAAAALFDQVLEALTGRAQAPEEPASDEEELGEEAHP